MLGEAGIGKTRLVAEAATEALVREAAVLRGCGWPGEQVLAFGPWVDALGAGRVTEPIEILGGLEPAWRAELARLLPELAESGHAAVDVPAEPRRLFESLHRLLMHLAGPAPLVIVLEDVHWADEMSLRLLAFLGRRIDDWPGLIVVTAREEEVADAPALRDLLHDLTSEGRLAQVSLGPLSRGETDALVRALARARTGEPALARLAERVWAASEGHPFLAVETLRALDEAPDVQALAPPSLPERIREVTAARLDRLDGQSRHLVAVAAVIGRDFEFPLAQRAAGLGEREAAEGLEALVRRRVLRLVGERFALVHDRIREVAYDQLLLPVRQALHAAVARAIETLYRDNLEPHWTALAVHHREGGAWTEAV